MGHTSSQPVYSVPLSKLEDSKGETPVYRNVRNVNALRSNIQRLPFIYTLQDLYKYAMETHANTPSTGARKVRPDKTLGDYEWKSYKEIHQNAVKAGSAILNADMAPFIEAEGNPTCRFIALYSKNREEWVTMDVACCLYGVTTVALYDTLGTEAIEFIYGQTGLKTTFSSGENLPKLLTSLKEGKYPSLKNVISFDPITEEQKKIAEEANINLLIWEEFLKLGENTHQLPQVTGDTIFTLSYTSGTTGLPKAAMLTHHNFVSYLGATEDMEGLHINDIGPNDIHISYLPLAHILERTFIHIALFRGARIGFSEALRLKDDMPVLKPTFLVSVPRLYNKFYDTIKAKMGEQTGFKKKIADAAVKAKSKILKEEGKLKHAIFDPLVFSKSKAVTGGNIKFYMCGSAPISTEVADFLKIAFCTPFIEGYGQTETCAAAFGQVPSDTSSGNVGGPMSTIEFKLVDVPDMKYTSQDKGQNGEPAPRGEICMKGHSIFVGYYKDAEKTKETIDENGWHHTGDIGMILPNGALKIIDRKKNIFKLAQGEYVAPEKVEQIALTSKYISEIFVYGDSFQTYCVAIIVPEKKFIMKLAEELGFTDKSFEDLCKEPKINAELLKDLNKTGKSSNLFGFEIPKAIHLEPTPFANLDLTTPSLKVKRGPAKDYYLETINKMYQETKVQ
jgi:long-chain acyl-CoA synthetase